MNDTMAIILITLFMAYCIHGAYLIIKDREKNNHED
jgi:hypothetical protein